MGLEATSGAGPGYTIPGDSQGSLILGAWRRFGGAGGDEDTSRRISQEVATEGMTGGDIQWRRFGGADGH